ncbi:uncharacterized protein METZ01_LOCUS238695, partial [marine metagenome]
VNFVSDVIPMWIKIGVAGSVVWTFLLYISSNEGMVLVDGFIWDWGDSTDDSRILVISGIAIIWLLSFLFLRKKPTD